MRFLRRPRQDSNALVIALGAAGYFPATTIGHLAGALGCRRRLPAYRKHLQEVRSKYREPVEIGSEPEQAMRAHSGSITPIRVFISSASEDLKLAGNRLSEEVVPARARPECQPDQGQARSWRLPALSRYHLPAHALHHGTNPRIEQ